MKKILFPLAFMLFFAFGCDENEPTIPCLSCDTTGGPNLPQDRVVIIEEFTGVRCVNCPQGSAEIENLLSIHGDRMVAVSIHSGFFANPYPINQYDFRTADGDAVRDLLGIPLGYPSAVVNRKLFDGEDDLQVVQQTWGGYISQQLDEVADVSLNLTSTYNDTDRSLTVNAQGKAFANINEEVRISILIAESNIMDAQLLPSSSDPDPNYIHKHVFRDMLTNSDGDPFATSLALNDTFEEEYTYTLPDEWEADNCNIIAFVHLAGADLKVLQAAEEHLAN